MTECTRCGGTGRARWDVTTDQPIAFDEAPPDDHEVTEDFCIECWGTQPIAAAAE